MKANTVVSTLLETEFNPDAVPSKENLLLMARPSDCKERCQVCNEAYCYLTHVSLNNLPPDFFTTSGGHLVPGEHLCQKCDDDRFSFALQTNTHDEV